MKDGSWHGFVEATTNSNIHSASKLSPFRTLVSCPINKCGFSAQEKGCGKARSAGNTLPYCQGTQRGHSPSPARPSGVGTIADGCVAALGNMPDIPCGLRLALGDCAHSESHLFMGQDTRKSLPIGTVRNIYRQAGWTWRKER